MCSAAVAQKRLCLYLATAAVGLGGAVAGASTFYTGADVSLLTFMQGAGVSFHDNGAAANGDQILYDAGANLFRLRIFVNPQTTYNSSALGAMQTTAYDIALSEQIKADDPAAKILLDFHYSDTWADPGHQTKPAAWTGAATLGALETDVTNYTASTLTSFKNAGVLPDMVQVGNETTSGMLWQTGSSGAAAVGGKLNFTTNPNGTMTTAAIQSWNNFGGLLNAAISGVRQVQGTGPRIPVALSIDSGDQNGQPQFFFGNITNPTLGNVTDFDIEGVDYYPSSGNSQKSFAFLGSNLTTLANTNFSANPTNPKKIMLLETDYPYTGTSNTIPMWGTTVGNTTTSSQAAQEQEFIDVRNTIMNLPHNDGEGVLWWYPEAVQNNQYDINNGGATALFNTTANNYSALAALSSTTGAFNVTGTITATWVTNQNADWNSTANWLGAVVPNGVGAEADLLAQISAPRTLTNNAAVTLGALYVNNANAYTVSGSGSLTMSVASGSALIDVLGGSQSLNVPVTIASNTVINVAGGAALVMGSPVTVNANQIVTPSGGGTISYQSSITLQSAAGIMFGNSFHATALTLSSGSAAVVSHGSNPQLLVQLDQLNFGNTTDAWQGKLDLNDNNMIVHGGAIGDITNQIKEGYGNGTWNGAGGIISSAAIGASNKTLGVELNDDGNGNALVTTFDGQTVINTDVLVKYTYFGDANLDGMVNGSDYTLIDNGFNSGLGGWRNGDFNYDGAINGDDYMLIDNAFNTQGSPLAVGIGPAATSEQIAVVPEPGIGIFAMVAMGMAVGGKRRRRVDA